MSMDLTAIELSNNIEEIKLVINKYLEFRTNSIMYKDLVSPEDFNKILQESDIMSCIEEELRANILRQRIERYMTEVENYFKEVDSYKLIYTALKNHYLSLNINEQIEQNPELYSNKPSDDNDEVSEFTSDDISVNKIPDNSDLYGAEFIKG